MHPPDPPTGDDEPGLPSVQDAGDLGKLDRGLLVAYRAWLAEPAHEAGISVALTYEGALAPIEAAGFDTHADFDGFALGLVRFADLAAVVAQEGVGSVEVGAPGRRPNLARAAVDIRARTAESAPGVWRLAGGTVLGPSDGTGRGVIVGIIDTGIDYTHPFFCSQIVPTKRTRILQIWDQGLSPGPGEHAPDTARLLSSRTYGVEYTFDDINAAINAGGTPLQHRDCYGHGTHVAGIAAGNPAGSAARMYAGIAPDAYIVAVKALDVGDVQFQDTTESVGWYTRFADAIIYCLRVARHERLPVVINLSFGADGEAGDGLDIGAQLIDRLVAPGGSPGDRRFPTGAMVVAAAGNTNDRERLAWVTVPADGEIIVPFELIDTGRHGETLTWAECLRQRYAPTLDVGLTFWYRNPYGLRATFALRLPHHDVFTGPIPLNRMVDSGVVRHPGATPRDEWLPSDDTRPTHHVQLRHHSLSSSPHPLPGHQRRANKATLTVTAKTAGRVIEYLTGIFEVKITAPAGTIVYLHGDIVFWDNGGLTSFLLANTMNDARRTARPVQAEPLVNTRTMTDGQGLHAITVGSYHLGPDPGYPDSVAHGIAASSSRGPLRDFSDPVAGPLASKPDVAAPGVLIYSAQTRFGNEVPADPIAFEQGYRYVPMSGTSIAAPMVTGVVALMLDKNPHLTVTDVQRVLWATARPGVTVRHGTMGDAYGFGMVDALEAYRQTPAP